MGLMVGWMAGRMKSGGVGVRVNELASEGRGEEGGTYLGRGSTTHVVGWHGHDVAMRSMGSSLEWMSRRRKGGQKRSGTYLGGGGFV